MGPVCGPALGFLCTLTWWWSSGGFLSGQGLDGQRVPMGAASLGLGFSLRRPGQYVELKEPSRFLQFCVSLFGLLQQRAKDWVA